MEDSLIYQALNINKGSGNKNILGGSKVSRKIGIKGQNAKNIAHMGRKCNCGKI